MNFDTVSQAGETINCLTLVVDTDDISSCEIIRLVPFPSSRLQAGGGDDANDTPVVGAGVEERAPLQGAAAAAAARQAGSAPRVIKKHGSLRCFTVAF